MSEYLTRLPAIKNCYHCEFGQDGKCLRHGHIVFNASLMSCEDYAEATEIFSYREELKKMDIVEFAKLKRLTTKAVEETKKVYAFTCLEITTCSNCPVRINKQTGMNEYTDICMLNGVAIKNIDKIDDKCPLRILE